MPAPEVLLITLPFPPFPDSYAKLRSLRPNITIHHYHTTDPSAVPQEVWQQTTIHLTHSVFPPSRAAVPLLKWTHLYSGGINQALSAPLFHDPTVHWTRNSGVHAPQIAEWAVAAVLAHYRQLALILQWQAERRWGAAEYKPRGELLGKTVAFLGYGAIARHTARIMSACGARVLAYTLHEKVGDGRRSETYTPARTGDPEGAVPEGWAHGDLDQFLERAGHIDVLVVGLPLTEKTQRMLGRAQFRRLQGCFVVNIARGDIIVQDELVEALNDGTLAGAALDATEPEPLPESDALWTARNTLVSPHVSGVSEEYMPRTVEIIDANLRRLESGQPLFNQILREDGY